MQFILYVRRHGDLCGHALVTTTNNNNNTNTNNTTNNNTTTTTTNNNNTNDNMCDPAPLPRVLNCTGRHRADTDLSCGQMGSALIGSAAKATNFDRLGKKVRPGTFGETKVG